LKQKTSFKFCKLKLKELIEKNICKIMEREDLEELKTDEEIKSKKKFCI